MSEIGDGGNWKFCLDWKRGGAVAGERPCRQFEPERADGRESAPSSDFYLTKSLESTEQSGIDSFTSSRRVFQRDMGICTSYTRDELFSGRILRTYGLPAVGVGGRIRRGRQLRKRLVAFGLNHDHAPPASQINPVDGVHAPNKATTMSFPSCTVSYNAPIPSSQRHRPPLCLPSEQQISKLILLSAGALFFLLFPLVSFQRPRVRQGPRGLLLWKLAFCTPCSVEEKKKWHDDVMCQWFRTARASYLANFKPTAVKKERTVHMCPFPRKRTKNLCELNCFCRFQSF